MQDETKKIVYLDIIDIKPYTKNSKKHGQAQIDKLKKSILHFGFTNPLLLDKNRELIAGHGRLIAAKELMLEKVPVIYLEDLTPEQVKAYRIADNKLAESEWDEDFLKQEFSDLKLAGFDLDLTGFNIREVSGYIRQEVEEVQADDPDKVKTTIKCGDIIQLGEHRLMCGDSTSAEDVDKLMNGEKVDMILTDPPYGMNLDTDWSSAKSSLSFANQKNVLGGKKYDKVIGDDIAYNPEHIFNMFPNVKEIFLWGADYYAERIPNKNKGSWIVWDKRLEESADKMYGSIFELCWSKNKHKRAIARVKWAGIFGTEKEFDHKRHHPTQKPINLSSWFINKYSEERETILDLFGGSGSTLIAAEQLNRKCYMMEIDPKYCEVIAKRWEKLTGNQRVVVNGEQ